MRDANSPKLNCRIIHSFALLIIIRPNRRAAYFSEVKNSWERYVRQFNVSGRARDWWRYRNQNGSEKREPFGFVPFVPVAMSTRQIATCAKAPYPWLLRIGLGAADDFKTSVDR
ncbi:hypothetical protein [Rhizobium sp. PDO1-076]|uniref:hypothetical protein n=1 Tax=Rhizobium sp. PDO1-076 TaxID=1125979 RepID=UPI00178C4FB6|nr:hypothetical protein [Rhizobium sp. PDO1-076]